MDRRNFVRAGMFSLLATTLVAATITAAPAPVPAPGPGVPVNQVQIDRTKSFVDTTISNKTIYVTVVVNYETTGKGYAISVPVFDENSSSFQPAVTTGNQTSYITTGAGTGTVTFFYAVDATSAWGQYILANQGSDLAWVVANMDSTIGNVSTDACWLSY